MTKQRHADKLTSAKAALAPLGRTLWAALWAGLALSCSASNPNAKPSASTTASGETATSPLAIDTQAVAGLAGVKVRFHADDHFALESPRNDTGCAGDIKTYYHPFRSAPAGGPSPLPQSAMDSSMSVQPSFIKNVSMDLTDASSTDPSNLAFSCSLGSGSTAPPTSSCASFDPTNVSYETGFYTLLDHQCESAGPISSTDPTLNKLLAGGVYFDLDRTALDSRENLLLHVTYAPLGPYNTLPAGTPNDGSHPSYPQLLASETASFKVHLIKTGLTAYDIRAAYQPRHTLFADTDRYPQVVQTLAILAPPASQPRQEQLLIPLSMDTAIDRIRIERHSGSGILIEAALYKAGRK